jgi:D-alanyl-D-alanine carboxypeptidase (penicillin-binding protein 5/6)
MVKSKIALILCCIILFTNGVHAETGKVLGLNAKSSLLMEAETGKILLEDNSHAKLPPASVTKVMTILLIYEALDQGRIDWEDIVTISAHAASMGGSQIYLETGEQQSVRDLTKSIVIASANDSAVAMAEYLAGSEEGFATMMNDKAKRLGMLDSNFVNACGLDTEGHVTSANDIAIMTRELILRYPEVYEFAKIRLDTITHKTARGEEVFGLTNTNRLIRNYPGATGLKTGSTAGALYCIAATALKEGMNLIAVVMGSPDSTTRFDAAMRMFDYGYANYSLIAKEPSGMVMGEIKVNKGKVETMPVKVLNQMKVLAPKGKKVVVDSEVNIDESVRAPFDENKKVGEIVYTCEGNEIGRSNLVVDGAVARANAQDMMGRVINRWMRKD